MPPALLREEWRVRRGARCVRVLGRAHGRGLQLLAGGEREPVRAAGPAGGGLGGVAAVHRAREDPVPEEAEDGGAQADDCGQGPEDCVLARQGLVEVSLLDMLFEGCSFSQ